MELQEQVDALEGRLKRQGRVLKLASGLLILTIAFLATRWILGIEGRLDIQGKRVYVHRGGGSLTTSTIHPHGLQTLSLVDASEPYGKHVLLTVRPDRTELSLRETSANENRELQLFLADDRSGLSLRDGQWRERVSLSLDADGPKLLLLDEKGQAVFQAP